MKSKIVAPLLIVFGALLPVAMAAPVSGDLGISGSATVTALSLDFFCSLGGCPGTAGDFIVSPIASNGSFSGLGNTRGFIQDISESGGQPLNTTFSLPNWISFLAAPDLHLDLQFIPLGQGTPSATCSGISFCTPIVPPLVSANNPSGLSAFNLTPGSASFEVRGIGYTGSSATGYSTFVGRFSADFPGLSPADIVALFQSPGITNKAYSAAFTLTIVPEPASGAMVLAAVGAMVLLSLRRHRSRAAG